MATPGPARWRWLSALWFRLQPAARHAASLRQSPLGRRIASADILSRGMLFAAVLLLCFVPFLLVLEELAGRDDASGFIGRFGLTGLATQAVRQAFTSPGAPSAGVDELSWIILVVGGISAATAIQDLYGRVFQVEKGGLRTVPHRVAWLAVAVGATFFEAWVYPWVRNVGGAVLLVILSAVGATLFWWFSMWLLLAGRLAWRTLFPCALATGICWLGMSVVFRLVLSSWISSDYRKYGSVGVVFAIMSLLIAVGVVLMLGALIGVAWQDRRPRPSPAPDPERVPGPERQPGSAGSEQGPGAGLLVCRS